jgi:hypothetical protein
MKICVICGAEYPPSPIQSNAARQKVCSHVCRKKLQKKRYHDSRQQSSELANCKNCGKSFVTSNKLRVYCSGNCKEEFLHQTECKACGNKFIRSQKFMYYCSEKCQESSHVWIKLNRKKKIGSTTECLNCQKKYTVVNNCQKHCSSACQQQFARRKLGITLTQEIGQRNCKTCEKTFIPSNFNSLYCSEPCKKTAQAKHRKRNYEKFQAKRLAARALKPKTEITCGFHECDVKFIPKNKEHRFCCAKHLKAHYRASAESKVVERKKKPLPNCTQCGVQLKSHFKKFCDKCFSAKRKKLKGGYVPEVEVESCWDADLGDFYKSSWATIGDRCKLDRTPTELSPEDSDFADEIEAFLKKGGKIKKLPVGFCSAPIMIHTIHYKGLG